MIGQPQLGADTKSVYFCIACAVHAHDTNAVIEEGRSFTKAFAFNNDVTRLTLACLDGGLDSLDSYISSNYQKFTKRELKFFEKAVSGDPTPRGSGGHKATAKKRRNIRKGKAAQGAEADETDSTSAGDDNDNDTENDSERLLSAEEGADSGNEASNKRGAISRNPNPQRPTKISPVVLAHYGQISLGARSFQGAICSPVSFEPLA